MISTFINRNKVSFFQGVVLAIVILLAMSVNYIHAQWNPPTQSPPNGNVAAPINVGTTQQLKDGNLSVGSISNSSQSGINPIGFIVAGSQRVEGWLKLGDSATGNPTQLLDLNGTAGNDGIKFPDNTLQTTAFPQNAILIFNNACPTGWIDALVNGSSIVGGSGTHRYCRKS